MSVDKYKKDIADLISRGADLYLSMVFIASPEKKTEMREKAQNKDKFDERVKSLPYFIDDYQSWYSEASACIAQLLPARVDDFKDYYKTPRSRKEITNENYTIADFLQGISVSLGVIEQVSMSAAIPKFSQQLNIVRSLNKRFDSALYDIRTLVQADLFDNELEVAEELVNKGFVRAAGAVTGVVLEGHLAEVCGQHSIKTLKAKPTMTDFNDKLKGANVIETATWRKVQSLGDIRNKCDHKGSDPSVEEVKEMIDGVRKIIKTVF